MSSLCRTIWPASLRGFARFSSKIMYTYTSVIWEYTCWHIIYHHNPIDHVTGQLTSDHVNYCKWPFELKAGNTSNWIMWPASYLMYFLAYLHLISIHNTVKSVWYRIAYMYVGNAFFFIYILENYIRFALSLFSVFSVFSIFSVFLIIHFPEK